MDTLFDWIGRAVNYLNGHRESEEGFDDISRIQKLIKIMSDANIPTELRLKSLKILRYVFKTMFDVFWPHLPTETQDAIKVSMLEGILQEPVPAVRAQRCDCTAVLARQIFSSDYGNNTWPELLEFVFHCAGSNDDIRLQCVLNMLTTHPGILGNQQNKHIEDIKKLFQRCLSAEQNLDVRVTAAKAAAPFILVNTDESEILNRFKDLLPLIIQVIVDFMVKFQYSDHSLLQALVKLAKGVPSLLLPDLNNVLKLCMQIIQDPNVPKNYSKLALEIVLTLSKQYPTSILKYGKFIPILGKYIGPGGLKKLISRL